MAGGQGQEKGHGGGRASEIYRHDERKWKAPTLIYHRGSGSAILATSSSCGRERAPGKGEVSGTEREKETESLTPVSMDRKSGPLSSQPVGYSSKGSLETVPIAWYRLTRGVRRVMRMGERSGSP